LVKHEVASKVASKLTKLMENFALKLHRALEVSGGGGVGWLSRDLKISRESSGEIEINLWERHGGSC
jgi:hypothetical protein